MGLEIASLDSGPGIADVEQALGDRYSTAGTRGTGLGAVNRLMDDLDIASRRGSGTHVVCRKWLREHRPSSRPCPLAFGVATRPRAFGQVNGDAFVLQQWAESALLGVIDGLGHGQFAHRAAQTARQYVESHFDLPLEQIFRGTGRACRATRGVVMALARFDWGQGRLSFASVGNILVRVLPRSEPFRFVIRRGVIGLNAPGAVVTEHPWPLDHVLVLHSDGVSVHWGWKDFPGWADRPAAVMAQELLRARPSRRTTPRWLWSETRSHDRQRSKRAARRRRTHDSALHDELAESNRGFVALSMELDDRVEQRTAELAKANEALRQSEQRYRLLFDRSPDGVFAVDAAGRFILANPACELISGYSTAELLTKSFLDLCAPDVLAKTLAHFERSVRAGTYSQLETALLRKDGRRVEVWIAGEPIVSGGGVVSVHCTAKDITDRKRAEEELKTAKDAAERAQAAAEQANRTKDHFLAVLSHELRTPLTPVVMGVAMLQDRTDLDPVVHETLEMVRRNVEMEARLIDDLLDVTRIARGKIELSRSPVELCKVIQRAVEVCKPDIEARRLRFGVDLGPAAPYWVEADVARLQQAFWNLLKNAIKFTPRGGCVGIRCGPDRDGVLVEVHDSGIGIEPEALSRIFNAFEQVERSITQQFGGLGLGLAISKALVEMHGGTIEAYSAGHGKGATFRVRLPLTAPAGRPEAPAAAVPPQPRRAPLADPAGRRPRRHREDDEDGADQGRACRGNGRRSGGGRGAGGPARFRSGAERSWAAGRQRPRPDAATPPARPLVSRHCPERLRAGGGHRAKLASRLRRPPHQAGLPRSRRRGHRRRHVRGIGRKRGTGTVARDAVSNGRT